MYTSRSSLPHQSSSVSHHESRITSVATFLHRGGGIRPLCRCIPRHHFLPYRYPAERFRRRILCRHILNRELFERITICRTLASKNLARATMSARRPHPWLSSRPRGFPRPPSTFLKNATVQRFRNTHNRRHRHWIILIASPSPQIAL